MINFPNNPSVGDKYTINNREWIWDGTSWNGSGTAEAVRGLGKGWLGGVYNPITHTVTFDSADGLSFTTGSLLGDTGLKGDTGTKGDAGAVGTAGTNGNDGKDGSGVVIKGSDTIARILSKTGNSLGDMWLASNSATSGGISGIVGDGFVYVGGTVPWDNVGPIRGPAGAVGTTGATGADGLDGADGINGTDGRSTVVTEGATAPTGAKPGDIWIQS